MIACTILCQVGLHNNMYNFMSFSIAELLLCTSLHQPDLCTKKIIVMDNFMPFSIAELLNTTKCIYVQFYNYLSHDYLTCVPKK